jgi:hypothetical protein
MRRGGSIFISRLSRQLSLDPPLSRNVRKLFMLLGLGLDLQFRIDGKVLILLGFAFSDPRKVFISNK